jgi:hypothetical protein
MAICLVSTFCLFRTRYVRYFIVLWCMLFMDFFNEGIGIYMLSSSSSRVQPHIPIKAPLRGNKH